MTIDFYNYYDKCNECLRKFSIDWRYYNGGSDEHLAKRNAYRKKIGFARIKREGSWFFFKIYFGSHILEMHVTLRKREYENEN